MYLHNVPCAEFLFDVFVVCEQDTKTNPGFPRKMPTPKAGAPTYCQILLKTGWKWKSLDWEGGYLANTDSVQYEI